MPLLVMAGKLRIFSNVHNVYAADLVFLRKSNLQCKAPLLQRMMDLWYSCRNIIGIHTTAGWPTNIVTIFILGCVTFQTIRQGYNRIKKSMKHTDQ